MQIRENFSDFLDELNNEMKILSENQVFFKTLRETSQSFSQSFGNVL